LVERGTGQQIVADPDLGPAPARVVPTAIEVATSAGAMNELDLTRRTAWNVAIQSEEPRRPCRTRSFRSLVKLLEHPLQICQNHAVVVLGEHFGVGRVRGVADQDPAAHMLGGHNAE
jgi:hypothetical protein